METIDITNGYYPTKAELKAKINQLGADFLRPMILYFASDPFSQDKIEGYHMKDYKELVIYCKELKEKAPHR